MQAVLDGEVLEVAQPGIDAAQRVVGRGGAADAGLARQSGPLRGLDDQLRQPLAAAAIEPVGLGIFVDQALKLARVAGKPAGGKRRRQMADRHRGDAALGLRRFARIADDEGIDHRQRPGDDFRKTFRGERDRLARQPFQRAVGAHMHERVDSARRVAAKGRRRPARAAAAATDRDSRRAAPLSGRDRAAARRSRCRMFARGSGKRRRDYRDRRRVRPRPRAAARPLPRGSRASSASYCASVSVASSVPAASAVEQRARICAARPRTA